MPRAQLRIRLGAELRDKLAAEAARIGLEPWRLAGQILRAAAGLPSLAPCFDVAADAPAAELAVSTSIRPSALERDAYIDAAEAAELTVGAWVRGALAAWLS